MSHRARELAVKQSTAQSNQIRGLLAEYGIIIIPKGLVHIKKVTLVLEDNQDKLTPKANAIFLRLYEQFRIYDGQVKYMIKKLNLQQRMMCNVTRL